MAGLGSFYRMIQNLLLLLLMCLTDALTPDLLVADIDGVYIQRADEDPEYILVHSGGATEVQFDSRSGSIFAIVRSGYDSATHYVIRIEQRDGSSLETEIPDWCNTDQGCASYFLQSRYSASLVAQHDSWVDKLLVDGVQGAIFWIVQPKYNIEDATVYRAFVGGGDPEAIFQLYGSIISSLAIDPDLQILFWIQSNTLFSSRMSDDRRRIKIVYEFGRETSQRAQYMWLDTRQKKLYVACDSEQDDGMFVSSLTYNDAEDTDLKTELTCDTSGMEVTDGIVYRRARSYEEQNYCVQKEELGGHSFKILHIKETIKQWRVYLTDSQAGELECSDFTCQAVPWSSVLSHPPAEPSSAQVQEDSYHDDNNSNNDDTTYSNSEDTTSTSFDFTTSTSFDDITSTSFNIITSTAVDDTTYSSSDHTTSISFDDTSSTTFYDTISASSKDPKSSSSDDSTSSIFNTATSATSNDTTSTRFDDTDSASSDDTTITRLNDTALISSDDTTSSVPDDTSSIMSNDTGLDVTTYISSDDTATTRPDGTSPIISNDTATTRLNDTAFNSSDDTATTRPDDTDIISSDVAAPTRLNDTALISSNDTTSTVPDGTSPIISEDTAPSRPFGSASAYSGVTTPTIFDEYFLDSSDVFVPANFSERALASHGVHTRNVIVASDLQALTASSETVTLMYIGVTAVVMFVFVIVIVVKRRAMRFNRSNESLVF